MMTAVTETILPLLPVKDMVLFINIEHPVVVGRPRSIAAIEEAAGKEDKAILVVTQRSADVDDPRQDDLYQVGTLAYIHRLERHGNNAISLTLRGQERVRIMALDDSHLFLQARYEVLPLPVDTSEEAEALHRDIINQAAQIDALMSSNWPKGMLPQMLQSLKDPMEHVYVLASLLKIEIPEQQAIHEATSRLEAMRSLHEALNHEIQVLTLQQEIASQAASKVSAEQRQYLLRQQLETIQKELGEGDADRTEVEELRQQLEAVELPEDVRKVVQKELERLSKMPPAAQDYQLTHAYLRLVAELPWNTSSADRLDLALARKVLDEDHFDLKEVKERIIEHLAMRKLNPAARSSILCLVGPPGVGKTSLGSSIAKALNREFERISLGGLHDEAELRGHRRTYIGAMPGRIIQALRRKGVNNPLILLDEVDKLGHDYRGDPAAALMEILDPSQNKDFRDNYLDLSFDLSRVFFVTTANTLDTIPRPLLDRMEVLRLSGYTEEEKAEIARRYLLPNQLRDVKLDSTRIVVPETVLLQIVRRYTREAGVRELNRQLARVVRKCAIPFAEGHHEPVTVSEQQLADLLGPERFAIETRRRNFAPGISTGLAWTEAGGDVLFIEAVKTPGGKGLILTGQLGEVMKESAQAALSYIWSQAEALGIDATAFHSSGVHIHVPAGAIPKDGPSAGVTMASALVSLFTGKAVRSDTAMTGEITLAGLVLPVGGIKEKVLAARRAGISRIVLPAENIKDLDEIDERIRQEIEFIPATHLQEVFAAVIPAP
ncbi:MAG: endopeptidase La [Pseudomonadales bacterium]|nr:endopeptidase La [Pseudomonadales bacterium]